MSAARIDELRRLVAETETNAGVEELIAAAREVIKTFRIEMCTAEHLRALNRLEEIVGSPCNGL